jgi:Uma2 family endonuclease
VPDIAVFEWNRLPVDEEGEIKDAFEIPPDWVIEIMSPGQSNALVIEKILFCLNQGTKLGWLIDVKEKIIIIFQKNQQPEVKRNNDILPVLSIFNDGQFSVNQLFQCLRFKKHELP